MKKSATSKADRNLDKYLFEAGQQCLKRLWLDYHEPAAEVVTSAREEMSRVGDELRTLARAAFPKGVAVEGATAEKAAAATKKLLDAGTPVLFDAAFVAEGVEARCDVLVVHKDGEIDLFEIKSGTKVKHRYVNDLALQATVVERSGLRLRRAYLLHVSPQYVHKAGADFPPMQLLRSADVTAKVQKQMANVGRRLEHFRNALTNEAALELPMGTYCDRPFPCPHLARCRRTATGRPLFELPELTRKQELELHKEGIEDLGEIAVDRTDLTFRQRRTLAAMQEGKRLVEPFVAEELRECAKPLHFVAIAALTEPLPRFDHQRPWQLIPYGWAATTVHEDGRVESASFVHADRDDPRPGFVKSLQRHLEVGGTLVCWNDEPLRELRALLDSLPDEKAAVRALIGQPHLDMMQLFEAGVFDPALTDLKDIRKAAAVLRGDDDGGEPPAMLDPEQRHEALAKARAPRVRAATKEKIAADIDAALRWQTEQLGALYREFSGVKLEAKEPKARPRVRAAKPLPKLPE